MIVRGNMYDLFNYVFLFWNDYFWKDYRKKVSESGYGILFYMDVDLFLASFKLYGLNETTETIYSYMFIDLLLLP